MVRLRFRILTTGETSILTDTHYKGRRKTSSTGIRLIPEKTTADKSYNKKQLALAELVRIKIAEGLINSSHGFKTLPDGKTDFFLFAEQVISNKGEAAVIKKLREFLKRDTLLMFEIDEKLLADFYRYLENCLNYETPSSYMRKLKKIINEAFKQKLIADNPSVKYRKFKNRPNEILTAEEMRILLKSRCPNLTVKRVFFFSANTGVRHSDAKQLRRNNIVGNILTFTQQKTGNEVQIVLNKAALSFVSSNIKSDELLFKLKSHTATLKALKKWASNAGIQKRLGTHSPRRIFASNLHTSGADILTISQLLGHSHIRTSQRYIKSNNHLKEQAVNNLPPLFLTTK